MGNREPNNTEGFAETTAVGTAVVLMTDQVLFYPNISFYTLLYQARFCLLLLSFLTNKHAPPTSFTCFPVFLALSHGRVSSKTNCREMETHVAKTE